MIFHQPVSFGLLVNCRSIWEGYTWNL